MRSGDTNIPLYPSPLRHAYLLDMLTRNWDNKNKVLFIFDNMYDIKNEKDALLFNDLMVITKEYRDFILIKEFLNGEPLSCKYPDQDSLIKELKDRKRGEKFHESSNMIYTCKAFGFDPNNVFSREYEKFCNIAGIKRFKLLEQGNWNLFSGRM